MFSIQNRKSNMEPIRGSLGESDSLDELPPPYRDPLSTNQSTNQDENQHASSSDFPEPVAGPSSDPPSSDAANVTVADTPDLNIDKSPPPSPVLSSETLSPPKNATTSIVQRPRAHKNIPWLPFASFFSAKRARQSVISIVSDLVAQTSRASGEVRKNAHGTLVSVAKTCAEHKLSLSNILQESFIMDHTPMYWAAVDYREELLVVLLVHSRPLSAHAISDIRRACILSSNQALFQALRVRCPPFHRTDGLQVRNPRVASDNLILGSRSSDEIHIQQTNEQWFVVSFDIPLWQRRMKAVGQVSIEFIASGRMWALTFFSTDPSLPVATSAKAKKGMSTWHVMINLLESSLPAHFDSQFIVDAPPPLARSTTSTFPSSRDRQHQSRYSMHEPSHDGHSYPRSSQGQSVLSTPEEDTHPSSSSSNPPPPTRLIRGSSSPQRTSTIELPSVSIRLSARSRQLGCRIGPGKLAETPTTKHDTWSEHGESYMNLIVAPLGEGLAAELLQDHSRYLFPDGTLRGRLDARLVKTESSRDCIIC